MNVIVILACVYRCIALLSLTSAMATIVRIAVSTEPFSGASAKYQLSSVGVVAILAGVQWVYAGELSTWSLRSRGVIADGLRVGLLIFVFALAPTTVETAIAFWLVEPDDSNFLLFLQTVPWRVYPIIAVFAFAVAALFLAEPIGQFLQSKDRS
ncbi:MAG: hypothetical protein WD716_13260 [Fimbriimonadaceae bacterium]